jgi:O-antigen/teichoic acid export membrane protein
VSDRTLGQRWRSTTVPYLALRGGGQAAEFVGWILLARRLGTTSFGELSVAVLFCRYGGLVADWGASIRGVRDVAEGRSAGSIRLLQRRRHQTTAVLAVVYVVATLALGYRDLTPLVVMAVGIGLNRDWIALGNEKGARSAAPAAVQGILLVGLALFASSASPSFAPAVAYGAGLVLSVILNPLPPREPEGVEPDQVDGWMLLAVLSNQVMSSADTLLLAFFASASVAGIYAAVYRLPNGWLALLVIVRGSLLPLATSVRREHPDQMGALRRSSMRWSCLSSLVLIAAMPVVYWCIPVIFGPDYRSGQWPAVLLLLATTVATASSPLHHLYLAFGHDRPYGWYLLAAAVLNVALNLVAIPAFGMIGAASATVAANVLLAVVLWYGVNGQMRTLPSEP